MTCQQEVLEALKPYVGKNYTKHFNEICEVCKKLGLQANIVGLNTHSGWIPPNGTLVVWHHNFFPDQTDSDIKSIKFV